MNSLTRAVSSVRCRGEFTLFLRSHAKQRVRLCTSVRAQRCLPAVDASRFARWQSGVHVRRESTAVDLESKVEGGDPYANLTEKMTEDMYIRKYLESSFHYTETMVRPNALRVYVTQEEAEKLLSTDWQTKDGSEMLYALRRLSHYAENGNHVDTVQLCSLLTALRPTLPSFDTAKLREVLKQLTPFYKSLDAVQPQLASQFYKTIDREFMGRVSRMSVPEMLLTLDCYFNIEINAITDFPWYTLRRMSSRLRKMTAKNFVQFAYYLNLRREPSVNMFDVELQFDNFLEDLSINEIAIVALAFFKTNSRIKNPELYRKIMFKLIDNVRVIDSVSVGGIMKMLRHSMQLTEVETFRQVLKALVPEIHRFRLMSLTHIAQAAAKVPVYNQQLIDKIIERLDNELPKARLKDMERIILSMSTFNLDPKKYTIYQKMIAEISDRLNTPKIAEIKNYSSSLLHTLQSFSYVNMYPVNLIQYVMEPTFVQQWQTRGSRGIPTQYYFLYYSIKIEFPEYKGPLPPEAFFKYVRELQTKKLEKDKNQYYRQRKLTCDFSFSCKKYFGNEAVYCGTVLPHYDLPDIVIGIDKNNDVVPVESLLTAIPDYEIKRASLLDSDITLIAFVLANCNLLINGSETPNGHLTAKMRQLKVIGYYPILISQVEWSGVPSTDKKKYFCEILSQNGIHVNCLEDQE